MNEYWWAKMRKKNNLSINTMKTTNILKKKKNKISAKMDLDKIPQFR